MSWFENIQSVRECFGNFPWSCRRNTLTLFFFSLSRSPQIASLLKTTRAITSSLAAVSYRFRAISSLASITANDRYVFHDHRLRPPHSLSHQTLRLPSMRSIFRGKWKSFPFVEWISVVICKLFSAVFIFQGGSISTVLVEIWFRPNTQKTLFCRLSSYTGGRDTVLCGRLFWNTSNRNWNPVENEIFGFQSLWN